ncbi:MAG: NAD(P)H-dependent oxidoreductase subunit E [Ferrimicrobium sp.]
MRTERSYAAWSIDRVMEIVDLHREKRGALLPILHDLQDAFGYIDSRAIELVAVELKLSQAEVLGVVTFYKDLRMEPSQASLVRVCRGESCQAMGAERLAAHAKASLAIDFGETTTDQEIALDQVFCLGNCALSPAVSVDGVLFGRVGEDRFDTLIAQTRSDASC